MIVKNFWIMLIIFKFQVSSFQVQVLLSFYELCTFKKLLTRNNPKGLQVGWICLIIIYRKNRKKGYKQKWVKTKKWLLWGQRRERGIIMYTQFVKMKCCFCSSKIIKVQEWYDRSNKWAWTWVWTRRKLGLSRCWIASSFGSSTGGHRIELEMVIGQNVMWTEPFLEIWFLIDV